MEDFDRCPACNAELDDSTHCPACGSAIPGRESSESQSSGEQVIDLGFEVVQGAGIAEDDFMNPPITASSPQAATPIPPEAQEPVPAAGPPQQVESSGIELESLVDPGALQEAAEAASSIDGGLELESMISVPEPAPSAPVAKEDFLDLELEMVEPEAAVAPPPVAPEKKTVRESKRETGSPQRASTATPPRATKEGATGGTDGDEPAVAPKKDKKKIGVFGFLLRAALFAGVVLGSVAVAYPPGIGMLRTTVEGMLGLSGVRHVTNMLVDPIEIYVDESLYGEILPGQILDIPVRAGADLRVQLLNPEQSNGMHAGDDLGFPLNDPMVAGDDEHYRVGNQSAPVWIFAPLISNPTGSDMMALINAGTGRARPCNCIIPAGARDHHIGYYAFEAGLRIRFVDAGSDYNSPRYREVANVTADVAANTGTVNVSIPMR